MLKVTLCKRIIVNDDLILEAERDVELPIHPFIGLVLYNTEWNPPDCDDSEDEIEFIAWDLKTNSVHCYLPLVDFRPESSGGQWPEEDIRERFQDWRLQRDIPIGRPSEQNGPFPRRNPDSEP
jgi:hypothetical protein